MSKCVQLPGFSLPDREFHVPLDRANPTRQQVAVFACEAVASGQSDRELPWLTNELVHSALRMDGEKVFSRHTMTFRAGDEMSA